MLSTESAHYACASPCGKENRSSGSYFFFTLRNAGQFPTKVHAPEVFDLTVRVILVPVAVREGAHHAVEIFHIGHGLIASILVKREAEKNDIERGGSMPESRGIGSKRMDGASKGF